MGDLGAAISIFLFLLHVCIMRVCLIGPQRLSSRVYLLYLELDGSACFLSSPSNRGGNRTLTSSPNNKEPGLQHISVIVPSSSERLPFQGCFPKVMLWIMSSRPRVGGLMGSIWACCVDVLAYPTQALPVINKLKNMISF